MQFSQAWLEDIDRDDDEPAGVTDFCDGFCGVTFETVALDDELGFSRSAVALALGDLPGEDKVFEVKDRKLVIFEFICCVGRDDVVESPNKLTDVGNGHQSHFVVDEGCRPDWSRGRRKPDPVQSLTFQPDDLCRNKMTGTRAPWNFGMSLNFPK